jgi:predicted membrane-bound mannosyltransferase
VATAQHDEHGEEWRLGIELGDDQEHALAESPAEPARNRSRERLERPLHVVTAEHLGWSAIALYATLTRLTALGARPLDGVEAGHALYEFDLASIGTHLAGAFPPASSGWIHALTAGVFVLCGANDFTARIVFALSGLLLIAMAFELRHYIGRAGGLALGAMLALSPSVTWCSRASATATPAAAMALVTIAVFMALKSRPGMRRAAALGLVAGLMIAANPAGLATAVLFVAALIPVGLWDLITGKNAMLAIRVWLDRYSSHLVMVIVVTALVWAVSQILIPGGLSAAAIARSLAPLGGSGQPGFHRGFIAGFVGELGRGLRFYLPLLTLYEFMIALAAVCGAVVIITLNVRSRFAAWALIWAALSFAYFCWAPERDTASILAILTPAAVVGAIGLDWLHHRDAWRLVRLPLAAIAALTLYIGAVGNFVCQAPDASEAPWARHANLFWGASATTEQARLYSLQAAAGVTPSNATVAFDDAIAAPLRWYLRDLRPVANADAASVVVSKSVSPANAGPAAAIYHFDYAEGWRPNFGAARAGDVIRFLFSGRIWGPVTTDEVSILVRKPATSAPTVILTPGR